VAVQDPQHDPGSRSDDLYRVLLRHVLVRLIFLYFVPLLLLALFFHVQYRFVVKDVEQRHLQSVAEHQAGLLDLYLGDRFLNLATLTDDMGLLLDPRSDDLQRTLEDLQAASEAFVDLAVLDERGRVLGYAGPLPDLVDRNYADQVWFDRLLQGRAAHVITDVYLGFRGQPHFTMALKLESQGRVRILRAALSPEKAQAHLRRLYPEEAATPDPGFLANITTNIWLFTAVFCLIGGMVIWLQARWVARQQLAAIKVEDTLSRQLLQASKLASVGELAAGVAHEINNPLAVILEKTGLVQDLLDPRFKQTLSDDILQEHLSQIERAVFRCTEITRQLLGFVRQTDVMLMDCEIDTLIDKLIDSLLGPELAVANIDVVKDYDPDLPVVLTDPGQLRQVILNLIRNADDAMTGPGVITIATRKHGDRFKVSVKDTGCGMTEEQMEKVFMPFYTTKGQDRGTGLGLSVSYGIIKGLGGVISVSSRVGAVNSPSTCP
jgi:two-component system, NtrC family, sensor kinase